MAPRTLVPNRIATSLHYVTLLAMTWFARMKNSYIAIFPTGEYRFIVT